MATLLLAVVDQNVENLRSRMRNEVSLREKEVADNVFSAFAKYRGPAADDQLVQAVADKYDALRDKLLLELLMQQVGEAEWAAMSERERQRRLAELRLKERQLRRAGDWDALAALLNEDVANAERLRALMGASREEYERRRAERRARRKARGGGDGGEDSGVEEGDEEEQPEEGLSAADLLVDLDERYEAEKQALLAQLHGRDGQFLSERERQARLLHLRREAAKAAREEDFATAARLVGLLERQDSRRQDRLRGDRARQHELARQRLARLREQRGRQPQRFEGRVDDADPAGNLLKLLETKHAQEEQQTAAWIDAALPADTAPVVAAASVAELEERLAALQGRLEALGRAETKRRHAVLLEAVHVKLRQAELGGMEREVAAVALIAALQNEQNDECERVVAGIEEWTVERLREVQTSLVSDIEVALCDNAARAVLALDSLVPRAAEASDAEISRAIDDKYDALRDQLLLEALIKQVGEAEWARMSEAERQRRLAELRLKERQLRREGRMEELAKLLGDAAANKEALEEMLGRERAEAERRLQERLVRRKKRLDEGMAEEEVNRLDAQEEAQEVREAEERRRNVLLDLDYQCEQEKAALLRRLQGLSDANEAEFARQQALVRLRRDQVLARREHGLVAAALVMGLANDSAAATQEEERRRQAELARERLEAARTRRQQQQPADEVVPDADASPALLRRAILEGSERGHEAERRLLLALLDGARADSGLQERMQKMDAAALETHLGTLARAVDEWRRLAPDDEDAFAGLMREAVAARTALRVARGEADAEAAEVALMVDLQQLQLDETQQLVAQLDGKTAEELQALHATRRDCRPAPDLNVSRCVLAAFSDASADAALLHALDQKYDAVRDKLLLDALMRQMGEGAWAALSERERQAELFQLKRRARQLELEGRQDEAAALLDGLLAATAELRERAAESLGDQRRRLDARRSQLRAARAAQGLPPNEAEVEAALAAEEETRKGRGVLERLDADLEAEKAALMAQLAAQTSDKERERLRQLQTVQLRRQARALALEDSETAALMVLAASQQDAATTRDLEDERQRQRRLAKERLEEARRKREKGEAGANEATLEQETPLEAMELAELQRTAAAALEERHNAERQLLLAASERWLGGDRPSSPSAKPEALRARLADLRAEFEALRASIHLEKPGAAPDEQQRSQAAAAATERRRVLDEAAAARLALESRRDGGGKAADEEAAVALLAALQTRQDAEAEALGGRLVRLKHGAVAGLVRAERQAAREAWAASLAPLLLEPEAEAELDAAADLAACERKKVELRREMVAKKAEVQQRKWAEGEEIDKEKLLKEIEAQYKRQLEAFDKERQKALAKVKARREERNQTVLEGNTALALVLASKETGDRLSSQNEASRQRQTEQTRAMLAARRAAREKRKQESEEEESRPPSSDTASTAAPRARRQVVVPTEEEQRRETERLLDVGKERMRKISQEKTRQEEVIKDRLEKRKTARQDQTRHLIELGEKQKVILQEKKQSEKDRQIQQMQERINRVRFERTQTRIASDRRKSVEPPMGATAGVDEESERDRKMEEMAARLKSRFLQEEAAVKEGKKATNIFNDDGSAPAAAADGSSSARIDVPVSNQKEMLEKIKAMRAERRSQRKKLKEEKVI